MRGLSPNGTSLLSSSLPNFHRVEQRSSKISGLGEISGSRIASGLFIQTQAREIYEKYLFALVAFAAPLVSLHEYKWFLRRADSNAIRHLLNC